MKAHGLNFAMPFGDPFARAGSPAVAEEAPTAPAFATREQWLAAATERLHAMFPALTCPVRVSCGFPATKALASRNRRIGECWPVGVGHTGPAQVFVSPTVVDAGEVLAVLAHELCHAALPAAVGHKGPFRSLALSIGLAGKMTATHAGPELAAALGAIAEALGAYPHEALNGSLRKKQTTRQRKWECPCGVIVRVAKDDFAATCDLCGEPFARADSGESESGD